MSIPNPLPLPSPPSLTPTILLALTLLLLTLSLLTLLQTYHRLAHIPGPLLNALTPLVVTYHCLKGDINSYNQSLVDRYGPLVRVTPTTVMISDAKTLQYVCSQRAGYRKGLWFEFARWSLERSSSLAMRGNEERKVRKGMLSPAVSSPFATWSGVKCGGG